MQIGLPQRSSLSSALSSKAEYTIYAYHSYDDNKLGYNRWQRVTSGDDPSQVLLKAEQLFQSKIYPKIEVKKKIFDDKKGCHKSSTLRIYEDSPRKNYLTLAAILLLAFTSAGLFYLQNM